ncbi:hypothetical protein OXYTRIMIC_398 [Oxytricha trifallax]|uniref:Uncharacterized protein n=1 Tax=Oxytricha trifallax TaxID=1172189 RepID=A0A073I0S0_9SPIT|nr:hypothetical protein OXYTRIMIC_398 [Oxytricha trifallax]
MTDSDLIKMSLHTQSLTAKTNSFFTQKMESNGKTVVRVEENSEKAIIYLEELITMKRKKEQEKFYQSQIPKMHRDNFEWKNGGNGGHGSGKGNRGF